MPVRIKENFKRKRIEFRDSEGNLYVFTFRPFPHNFLKKVLEKESDDEAIAKELLLEYLERIEGDVVEAENLTEEEIPEVFSAVPGEIIAKLLAFVVDEATKYYEVSMKKSLEIKERWEREMKNFFSPSSLSIDTDSPQTSDVPTTKNTSGKAKDPHVKRVPAK